MISSKSFRASGLVYEERRPPVAKVMRTPEQQSGRSCAGVPLNGRDGELTLLRVSQRSNPELRPDSSGTERVESLGAFDHLPRDRSERSAQAILGRTRTQAQRMDGRDSCKPRAELVRSGDSRERPASISRLGHGVQGEPATVEAACDVATRASGTNPDGKSVRRMAMQLPGARCTGLLRAHETAGARIQLQSLLSRARVSAGKALAFLIPLAILSGCDRETQVEREAREAKEAWDSDDCADVSTLLATTTGSPSSFSCPNKRHRMRVQVATAPSNEEAAALVFCECEREDVE